MKAIVTNVDRTILLVEDEPLIAFTEKMLLERSGYAVITADSGDEALTVFGEQPEIALVLMDIDLGPGRDGPDTAREMLRIRDVPIVFLTSHAEREYVERVEEITSYGYVLKNSGEFVLLQAVKMAFRLYHATQESEHSRRWFATTFDSIGDAVITTDTEGRVTRLNRKAEEITGYSSGDASGLLLEKIFPIHNATTGDVVANPVHEVLTTGRTVEMANHTVLQARDGREFQIADSAAPIVTADGTVRGVVLVFRDVTETYRRREELRRSQAQLKRAQTMAQLGSWEFRLGVGDVVASEEALRIYGIDDGTLTIPRAQAVVLPEYRRYMDDALAALVAGTAPYDVDFRIARENDGTVRDVHSVASYDPETRTVFGIIQDITERKRVETHLRRSEARLRSTLEATNAGIWEWNVRTGELVIDERWAAICGYRLEELAPVSVSTWRALAHPDDLEESDRLIEQHLAGRTDHYSCEVRMRHKSGGWVWILDKGRVSGRDADGAPKWILGTHQDITARKRLEEERTVALAEKQRAMEELNHRVKNNLAMVVSLLSLKEHETRGTVDLSDVRSRIDAIRTIHQHLQQSERVADISLDSYLGDLVQRVVTTFSGPSVILDLDLAAVTVPTRTATAVGLLVNELVSNAMKHAFPGEIEPRLAVSLRREDAHLRLAVENNGHPFPESVDIATADSLGLQLVRSFVDQVDGDIEVRRSPDTRISVTFPA